jgi:hypothetical protein
MSTSAHNSPVVFKERASWPIWLWVFLLFLSGSLSIAIWAALGNTWAEVSMLTQLVGLLFLSQSTPLQIEVTADLLRVGPARIERKYISGVTSLTSEEMRILRGPKINTAAYMQIRFWISTGVKITISDPQDPTPYWLVSSKKAHQLAGALNK